MLSIFLNESKTTNTSSTFNSTSASGGKVDCAKECPCGVPVIPVPDQWLEVMVTGGFKVWHIIFIIIAVMITMTVVYCCFHRCRIPRTKQEIEADLMRSNLTNKFRDYLQEIPNEPTTFVEALKKVQELEEKLEKDDAMMSRDLGARKRMGWLKLKGKDEKAPAAVDNNQAADKTSDNLDTSKQVEEGNASDNKQDASQVIVPIGIEPGLQPASEPPGGPNVDISQAKVVGGSAIGEMDDQTEAKSVAPGSGKQQRRTRRTKPNLSRSKRPREKSPGEAADLETAPHLHDEKPVYPSRPISPPPPQQLVPGALVPSPTQKERHHKLHRRHKVRKEPKVVGTSDTGDTHLVDRVD